MRALPSWPQIKADASALAAEGGRIGAFDGLRTFAVLAVLACHTMILPLGWHGVSVFFVLSGYLITGLLLNERAKTGRVALGRFYLRRGVRLLPALLFMLAAFSVYDLVIRSRSLHSASITNLPAVIFYVGNWVQVRHGVGALDMWGHTWTLAVEEQFYLVWPLVMLLAARIAGRSGVAAVALAVTISMPFWRDHLFAIGGAARMRGTDAVAGSLMIGCALTVAAQRYPETVRSVARWLVLPALAALLWCLTAPASEWAREVIEPSVVTAAAAVLIARIVTVPAGLLAKGLSAKPLVVLGRLSYGIYLWHVPMTMALDGHIHNHLALAAVVMVLSSAAALVSWVMVEMPAQRLRQAMEARSVRRLAVLNRASA